MARNISAASALQWIGGMTLGFFAYNALELASFYLLPAKSLSRYQGREKRSWALITGASAGIGLGTAQELALRGFDIILLGHLPAELDEARDEIKAESPDTDVRIIVLNAATASPELIEMELLDAVRSYANTLTVLVNNVGGVAASAESPFSLRDLTDYSADDLDGLLNLNARFMAHVSRILLPVLADNGPSLVLNVSSAARMGIAKLSIYSGSKGFVTSLNAAMAREMAPRKVDCLTAVPADVRTVTNNIAPMPWSPDVRQFARAMLDMAPRAVSRGYLEYKPWWSHLFVVGAHEMVPPWLSTRFMVAEFRRKRRKIELAMDMMKKKDA